MTIPIPEQFPQGLPVVDYEVHFTLPNGEASKVYVEADQVDINNPYYLIFLREAGLVLGVPHGRVLDWGERLLSGHIRPVAQPGIVRFGDGDGGKFRP